MRTPRRGSDAPSGKGRSAAREGRPTTGRDGRKPSAARPASSGSPRGFNKDRFVRGAGGDGADDRPFRRDDDRAPRSNDRRGTARDNDRPFNRNERPSRDAARPSDRGDRFQRGGDRPFGNDARPQRGGDRPFGADRPRGDRPPGDSPFRRDGRPSQDRPFRRDDRSQGDRPFRRDDRPGQDRPGQDRPFARNDRPGGDRPFRRDERGPSARPPFNRDNDRRDNRGPHTDRGGQGNTERPYGRPGQDGGRSYGEQKRQFRGGSDRPAPRRDGDDADRIRRGPLDAARPADGRKPKSFTDNALRREQERTRKRAQEVEDNEPLEESDGKIRLNKFIAAAGVCSRREADRYIEDGRIAINGKTVTELGFKVNPDDEVRLGGRLLRPEKHVYILLNKPKDYITSLEDEEGRRTVMDLLGNVVKERIYPVGRLDRNTTGLLLLTNDGDLATRLMHPSFEIRKVYQVDLDKPLSDSDAQAIRKGLMLEDGPAHIDDMAMLTPDRKSIGLELHIGRNRIVRRIFEHLGYNVLRLDRVMYGGLTKKDLPRGKYRMLSSQEIINIKHLGASTKGGKR